MFYPTQICLFSSPSAPYFAQHVHNIQTRHLLRFPRPYPSSPPSPHHRAWAPQTFSFLVAPLEIATRSSCGEYFPSHPNPHGQGGGKVQAPHRKTEHHPPGRHCRVPPAVSPQPPKGFDDWFAFAQANDVKIIDEYDSLVNDLAPFWNLPGEEVRRRAQQVSRPIPPPDTSRPRARQVGQLPSIDLVRLDNGTTVTLNIQKHFNDTEDKARAKGFRVMIEKFQARVRLAHARAPPRRSAHARPAPRHGLSHQRQGGGPHPRPVGA